MAATVSDDVGMRAIGRYYGRVFKRTIEDAWQFGWDHVVFALLVLAAGFLLGLLMGGVDLTTLTLYPLAAIGGACVLLFLGSLVLAPVRLDREPRPGQSDALRNAIEALDAQRFSGQELLDSLNSSSKAPADPVEAVDSWLRVAEAAVEGHTHGQIGRFMSDAGLGYDRELSGFVLRRMQRLDEIINVLHFPGAEGLLPE